MLKNPIALFDIVERLANVMRGEFRRIGGEEGLQPVHIQALLFLQQANRFSNTPQALSEYLNVTKGTVSQSLLLLDRHGLIERYQDDVDKRVVRLRLSLLGEAFLDETNPAGLWQSGAREISAHRIRYCVTVLRTILFEMQSINGGTPFGVCNNCIYYQRKSQRIHHCAWFGERLSGPETRKICREQAPKSSSLST
ncbi:MarR family winged helix-turn-helix transcriptional regulator [Ferrovum sp. PN-J185]|uniref:MarR family winged helix-turn-helix transcriptional regulator n=1 Tax=Ferrovum sp. PN-J185 TaxID=1356306 RepID=UPI0007971B24|nr:MarR family winged helix-turn-helix transcriptional regulator [Ferrovum sp. PN-J185]KXW55992.1 MarR family protein [Ferrovum sp. PN-J185]MCC6068296.1 MarR family winged helix-turn-helix transcriptional regulator [Ferrovum sp. PN-J185]MDE1892269.1 winged helix-turn-helix transcriptional regulator [Betaproteobacteria bacterium]MDE2056685.1 winged helix-turn-helix transcriptional regulator [Betaproteobacteria bacterium]